MSWSDAAKALGLLVLLVLLQVTIVTPIEVASGHPDLVLVFLVSLALLRGPMLGAVAGFWAGLLLDSAALAPPGVSESCPGAGREMACASWAMARGPGPMMTVADSPIATR